MEQVKPWWQSRTIWSGLATSIVAILMGLGMLPPTITVTMVDEAVLALLGLATVISRAIADKKIERITE